MTSRKMTCLPSTGDSEIDAKDVLEDTGIKLEMHTCQVETSSSQLLIVTFKN